MDDSPFGAAHRADRLVGVIERDCRESPGQRTREHVGGVDTPLEGERVAVASQWAGERDDRLHERACALLVERRLDGRPELVFRSLDDGHDAVAEPLESIEDVLDGITAPLGRQVGIERLYHTVVFEEVRLERLEGPVALDGRQDDAELFDRPLSVRLQFRFDDAPLQRVGVSPELVDDRAARAEPGPPERPSHAELPSGRLDRPVDERLEPIDRRRSCHLQESQERAVLNLIDRATRATTTTVPMSTPSVRSRLVDRLPRLWALWAASRPSQVALVVLVYLFGVGMSTVGPPLVAGSATAATPSDVASPVFASRVFVGAIALLPVTVTIHYANEYADADTDALTDRTPFSGGSGALARTGLPRSFLRRATVVAVSVSAVTIATITGTGQVPPAAAGLLVATLLAGLAYSLPPVALVRRGVGEFVNAALGGVALPVYGVAVVATPTVATALVTIPFAAVVGCNLLATHWPDRRADERVGKRTLAVRWSPRRIRRAYVALAGVAALATAALWVGDILPTPVAAVHLLALPFLVWGRAVLTRQRSPLPSVLAMVVLALAVTVAWWRVGVGP